MSEAKIGASYWLYSPTTKKNEKFRVMGQFNAQGVPHVSLEARNKKGELVASNCVPVSFLDDKKEAAP